MILKALEIYMQCISNYGGRRVWGDVTSKGVIYLEVTWGEKGKEGGSKNWRRRVTSYVDGLLVYRKPSQPTTKTISLWSFCM